jgi:hypothetical protein
MTAAQWITVASLAAVVVSALAIVAGLKGVRDQLRVTIFLEYTKRYSKVMRHMPFEAREPGGHYRLSAQPKEERYRILSIYREYLNMCSEEKWLHDHRRIDHAAWSIWERGMRDTASFPSFGEAWEDLRPEYDAYTDFQKFVNEIASDRSSKDELDRSPSS